MMGKDEYSVLLEEDSSGTRHNVPKYQDWGQVYFIDMMFFILV
jgi:hypothetical protein